MITRKKETQISNSLKLIVKSSLVVFAGMLFSKLFTYLYRIILARHYGPDSYGLFSLAIAVIGLLTTISTFGFIGGLERYIPFYRGRKEVKKIKFIFKKTMIFFALASIVLMALLFLTSDFIAVRIFKEEQLGLFLKLFSIAIPLGVFGKAFLSLLKGFEKIELYSAITNFLDNFSRVVFLWILIVIGAGIISIPLSYLFGVFVVLVTAMFFSIKILPEIFRKKYKNGNSERFAFQSFVSYSWPLVLFGFVLSIFHWTDSFVIGIFQTAKEVGFYNIAMPLAILLTLPKDIMMQLFLPMITRKYGKNEKDEIEQLSRQVSKWILIISLPIFILFMVFPDEIINSLFGSEYLVAKTSFRLLSISAFVTATIGFSRELVLVKGKSRTIFYYTLVFTVVNFLLNLLLVPKYGIDGAAVATMTSLILLNLVFMFQIKKDLAITLFNFKSAKVFFAGFISLVLLILLRQFISANPIAILVLAVFFVSIYSFLIVKTKCLDENDKIVVRAAIGKLNKIYSRK